MRHHYPSNSTWAAPVIIFGMKSLCPGASSKWTRREGVWKRCCPTSMVIPRCLSSPVSSSTQAYANDPLPTFWLSCSYLKHVEGGYHTTGSIISTLLIHIIIHKLKGDIDARAPWYCWCRYVLLTCALPFWRRFLKDRAGVPWECSYQHPRDLYIQAIVCT